jgi:transglutaminase-like putative cysteine protease
MAVAYSFYPHELALEAGVQPLDSVILRLWPEERLEGGARFYWAVRRYDTYQDGTWRGTLGTPWAFNPDQATLPVAQYRGRKAVQVRIEPQIPVLEALAVLPQTEWVDQPAKIRAHITPEGLDPLAFEIDTILWQETSYLVRGTVAAPSAEALRSASPQYPQWVLDHYLQLPASLTPRTRELAQRITGGLQNPYDKAQAITSWLRRNVRYSRQTQPPPLGVEPLDWFLFDYRVGFCNWYASAEVIMLRSLGVPARLVVGFARGKFSDEGGFYEVSGEDAHAWPEVYFPGYGWVEFEPTGSQPALNRREPIGERALEAASPGGIWGEGPPTLERAEEESFGLSPIGPEADSARRRSAAAGRALVGLVVASCGIFLTRLWLDPGTRLRARIAGLRFLNRLAPKPLGGFEPLEHGSPLTLAYAAWNAWLPRLAVETGPHMTPMERAAAFAQSYPHLAPQAWALVHAYVGDRYGGQRRSLPLAMDRWRELRPRLWRAWLRQLLIARLRPPSARGHKPGPSPWPSPGPRG